MTRPTFRAPWVLAGVAVVAAVLAGYFGWLTVFRPAPEPVRTTTEVNRVGGYTLQVPTGMSVARSGKATTLSDRARSLAVTVTTTRRAAPRATEAGVLRAIRATYPGVTLLGSSTRTVDHHPARSTYGAVVTGSGARIEFVLVAVRGAGRSYALSAFVPMDADKRTAAAHARFEAIVDGLRLT